MLRSSLRFRKKWLLSTIMTVLLLEKHFLTEEGWCDWPTNWNTYRELHTHTKTNTLCLTVCTAVYNTHISRLLLIWGWRAASVLSPSSTLAAAAALEASLGCAGLTQLMWLSAPLVAVSWLVGCLEHISGRDVSAWQSRHSKLTENWVWVSINGCAAWLAGWLAGRPTVRHFCTDGVDAPRQFFSAVCSENMMCGSQGIWMLYWCIALYRRTC